MPVGRPTKYTKTLAAEICSRIADGHSVRSICAADDMPNKSTVFRWLGQHETFRDQYAIACDVRNEVHADELLDIADDGSNDYMTRTGADGSSSQVVNSEAIARSRLRVDTRKWLLSKLQPKKYGDKLDLSHTGKNGGPIETRDVTDLTPVERAQRLAAILAAGGIGSDRRDADGGQGGDAVEADDRPGGCDEADASETGAR